jgi:hypothetical protein
MFVHQETIADVAVTLDRYGPRAIRTVPGGKVLAVAGGFGVVAADTIPAESTASIGEV